MGSLVKKDAPYVFTVKCSCHVIYLCSPHACLKMSTTLEDLCSVGILFESSDPFLHHLCDEVLKLLKSILSDFMNIEVVKSCNSFTVSLNDPSLNVHNDQVYLGVLATITLNECQDQ